MAQQTDHIGDANKMVTAVEWLDRWYRDNPEATHEEGNKALEQAKRMHKQQTVDAYKHGQNNGYNYRSNGRGYITGEEYFEQTFTTQAQ